MLPKGEEILLEKIRFGKNTIGILLSIIGLGVVECPIPAQIEHFMIFACMEL